MIRVLAYSSKDTRAAPGKAAANGAPQAAREETHSERREREGQRLHSRCATQLKSLWMTHIITAACSCGSSLLASAAALLHSIQLTARRFSYVVPVDTRCTQLPRKSHNAELSSVVESQCVSLPCG